MSEGNYLVWRSTLLKLNMSCSKVAIGVPLSRRRNYLEISHVSRRAKRGSKSVLKAIIVDVDGTLYSQPPVRRYVASRLFLHALRRPAGAWRTARALSAYRHAQESLRGSSSPIAANLQLSWAAEKTGYGEDFVSGCVTEWMDRIPLPALAAARYSGIVTFLAWATERGLRIAALSDYNPHETIRALGLADFFSVVVHSQEPEVGVFKPNPKGLRIAQQRLDAQPHEVVYIGDRPEVDGAVALTGGVAGFILSPKLVQCPPGVEWASDWMQIRRFVEARMANISGGTMYET